MMKRLLWGADPAPVARAALVGALVSEFQHWILLAVQSLGEQAYGAEISRFLLRTTGRDLALAQVYVTLRRLEKKGFLSSKATAPRKCEGF